MRMTEKANEAIVTIFRFDASVDDAPRYERYAVPYEHWYGLKVIDTIRYLYETKAPDLSFREPCRQQICGACMILLNKKPVLACSSLSEAEMLIEPIANRRVLKDLITVMSDAGSPETEHS
jgi:succinate dehydrogenase/fumarate reductase-like Fe-S protein